MKKENSKKFLTNATKCAIIVLDMRERLNRFCGVIRGAVQRIKPLLPVVAVVLEGVYWMVLSFASWVLALLPAAILVSKL